MSTLIVITSFIFLPQYIQAYLPFAAAETAYIEAERPADIRPGALVARGDKDYKLTDTPYESSMLGVVVETSDVVVTIPDSLDRKQQIVATSGELPVLVNSSSGSIAIGDYITSSHTPGVGAKALSGGIVIGTALEKYENKNVEEVTPILVRVNIQIIPSLGPAQLFMHTITDLVKFGPQGMSQVSPFIRYSLVLIILFVMGFGGFYMFGRIALRGIEALGRNPLARSTIVTGIVINSLLMVALVVIGVVLAYILITV